MSVDYTIAAIPTEYRGIRYRSRLEARWAAFFDELGWSHTYEPFDLGRWSPDFLLRNTAPRGADVLIEVKPITEIDRAAAWRMEASAWRGAGLPHELLLLGVGPFEPPPPPGFVADHCIGWSKRLAADDGSGPLRTDWQPICAWELEFATCDFDASRRAWPRACNTVQWHARR